MPGFVDCHTHVVSYLLAGLRSKFDSIQSSSGVGNGVNERRIRTLNVISNDKHAINLFTAYVVRLTAAWRRGMSRITLERLLTPSKTVYVSP